MVRAGPRVGLVTCLLVAWTASARAQPPTYRLDYRAAAACPSRDAVTAAVARRLARDPFAADAPVTLRIAIEAADHGWRAAIDWIEDGAVVGSRRLTSPDDDCRALASAVALAVVIAIDPLADAAEPIELAPEPASEGFDRELPPVGPPPVPPPPEVRRSGPERRPERLLWSAGAGAVATVGAAPRWTPAAAALVEVARGRLALGLHLQLHWPRAEPVGPGEVRGWLATGSAVPCLSWGSLAGCGLVSAGFVRGRGAGGLDQTRAATTFHAAVGSRLQWTFWRGRLAARIYADGQVALARTALTVNEMDVWELPAASAGVGLLGLARW